MRMKKKMYSVSIEKVQRERERKQSPAERMQGKRGEKKRFFSQRKKIKEAAVKEVPEWLCDFS